jgi:hypothetical protein
LGDLRTARPRQIAIVNAIAMAWRMLMRTLRFLNVAVLSVLVGGAGLIYAQDDKPQEDHPAKQEDAKPQPKQDEAKPPRQDEAKPPKAHAG